MRFHCLVASPVQSFNNHAFWQYVYDKGKAKQIENVLKTLNFDFVFVSFLNEYYSTPPFILIEKLHSQRIFSKQELIEICNKIFFDEMMKSETLGCIQNHLNDSHHITDLDNSSSSQDPDGPMPPNDPTPPSNGSSPSPLFYLGQSRDS